MFVAKWVNANFDDGPGPVIFRQLLIYAQAAHSGNNFDSWEIDDRRYEIAAHLYAKTFVSLRKRIRQQFYSGL